MIDLCHRAATVDDCALLADLNRQFLLAEGHRRVFLPNLGPSPDAIPIAKLEERMRSWLSHSYNAVLFSERNRVIAYGLYSVDEYEVYLQQFFVVPDRRREGIGRSCFEILRREYWPSGKRLTLGVLADNKAALAFWRALGYQDYSIDLFME